MSEQLEPKPINAFPGGARVVIDSLSGGHRSRGRLCALGLVPGTTVVVKDTRCEGCRIFVRESELVLGQGMAEKVLARTCREVPKGD
jgi:ferrous iron transport protein A